MFNWIRKFLTRKPYTCCMELHNEFGCYVSIYHPSKDSIDGFNKFFKENYFLIVHNIFDSNWEDKIKLEEIHKKLTSMIEFDCDDKNLIIVYNEKKVYIKEHYILIPSGGIFVYDKTKVDVIY